jgi:hypothetical protein
MPKSTVFEIPQEEQAQMLAALRRAIVAAIHQKCGAYRDFEPWVESNPLVAVELLVE